VCGSVSFGVQSRLLLIKQSTSLSNVGLQGGLRATSFNPLPSLFYLGPKEREVSGWPELDLKDFWELGLDILENLPHCIIVLDQGINWS
jgi:hypothetical protein